MHKKTKFDKPRQQRRQSALARFPHDAITAESLYMRQNKNEKGAEEYVLLRKQELTNLQARIMGSAA